MMRGLGSLIGLLIVALIAVMTYKFYFEKAQSTSGTTPLQTINIVGVKNDLLAMAQAERAYQAEHGTYASLGDLTSSGALTMTKGSRDGYVYDVDLSGGGFRVFTHCPTATNPGCQNWSVDQAMEVQPMP
jgi:hypothetical protein